MTTCFHVVENKEKDIKKHDSLIPMDPKKKVKLLKKHSFCNYFLSTKQWFSLPFWHYPSISLQKSLEGRNMHDDAFKTSKKQSKNRFLL